MIYLSFTGTYVVFVISAFLRSSKILSFLGRNSLILMCVHEPIKRIVIKVMSMATGMETEAMRNTWLVSLLILAAVVVICVPIIWLVNNKLKFMIGK